MNEDENGARVESRNSQCEGLHKYYQCVNCDVVRVATSRPTIYSTENTVPHSRPQASEQRVTDATVTPKLHLRDKSNLPGVGSRGWADAGHCSLSPQTCQQKGRHGQIWVDNLENTLRRSRGAIGRYRTRRPPGAPLAAARVPRWPWTAPTTFRRGF